jgi:hypothetical protein
MSKPDFNLLVPIEYGEGDKKKTRWVRFGSLWKNKDGDGFSGKVDFWPAGAGDRVVLLPPKDTPTDAE